MWTREYCHGREPPRPSRGFARTAPAVSAFAQGRESGAADRCCWQAGIRQPAAAAGSRRPAQAQGAVHPALEPQSLRGACESGQVAGDDSRPGVWQAHDALRRGVGAFHRGGAGTDADGGVPASQGGALGVGAATDWAGDRLVAGAGVDRAAVAGLAGVYRAGAVLPAMGGGSGAGVGGSRVADGDRPGLWLAGAVAGRHPPVARLGGGVSVYQAGFAMDG